jgi:hypothetical protein
MKALVATILAVCFTSAAVAAPIPSTEISRTAPPQPASAEQWVAERLATLGMSQTQIQTVMNRLDAKQVEELAAQLDLVAAGGTIQGERVKIMPVEHILCLFQQLGIFVKNFFGFIFCWKEPRAHFSGD